MIGTTGAWGKVSKNDSVLRWLVDQRGKLSKSGTGRSPKGTCTFWSEAAQMDSYDPWAT